MNNGGMTVSFLITVKKIDIEKANCGANLKTQNSHSIQGVKCVAIVREIDV